MTPSLRRCAILPALLPLLFLSGCGSMRSPDAMVQGSVMSGRSFKAHLGEFASASAEPAVASAYVTYLGSDAAYHHFSQGDRQGQDYRKFMVPRGDMQIRQEFPYDERYFYGAGIEPLNVGAQIYPNIIPKEDPLYPRPYNAPVRAYDSRNPRGFGQNGLVFPDINFPQPIGETQPMR